MPHKTELFLTTHTHTHMHANTRHTCILSRSHFGITQISPSWFAACYDTLRHTRTPQPPLSDKLTHTHSQHMHTAWLCILSLWLCCLMASTMRSTCWRDECDLSLSWPHSKLRFHFCNYSITHLHRVTYVYTQFSLLFILASLFSVTPVLDI